MPTYTTKRGKTYRYYAASRDLHFGAGASDFGNVPAEPLEELVLTQVQEALSAPHVVQAVWDAVRRQYREISEPEVVLPMRRLAMMWPQLFPAGQYRLVRLLVDRVVIGSAELEIICHGGGWQGLANELIPGTIGAELADWEVTA
jgi:hypothetical protein